MIYIFVNQNESKNGNLYSLQDVNTVQKRKSSLRRTEILASISADSVDHCRHASKIYHANIKQQCSKHESHGNVLSFEDFMITYSGALYM